MFGAGRSRRWIVLAAALILGAAVVLVFGNRESQARYVPPPGERSEPPGERLVPTPLFKATRSGEDDGTRVPFFEVVPDGTVASVFWSAPENLAVGALRPLPDGRMVVLGVRDTMPERSKADGLGDEGFKQPLLTIGPNGRVQSDEDIQVAGGGALLIGATDTDVLLQRSTSDSDAPKVVARDLDTGAERELAPASPKGTRGDVAGDRVVLAGGGLADNVDFMDDSTRCWVELVALSGGTGGRVTVSACHYVVEVNVSPDGRFAAMVYQRWGDPDELRLLTVDLDTVRVRTDELLGNPGGCVDCVAANADYLGMAWIDGTTLRSVFMAPLPIDLEPDEVLSAIEDRLRTQIRTMIT